MHFCSAAKIFKFQEAISCYYFNLFFFFFPIHFWIIQVGHLKLETFNSSSIYLSSGFTPQFLVARSYSFVLLSFSKEYITLRHVHKLWALVHSLIYQSYAKLLKRQKTWQFLNNKIVASLWNVINHISFQKFSLKL